jgi:GAF domain-containing protein
VNAQATARVHDAAGSLMSLLHQINESFNSALGLEPLMERLLDFLTEATQADACVLYLLNSSEGNLTLRAARLPYGIDTGAIRIEIGDGIAGWVAQQRTAVVLPQDASRDSRFRRIPSLPEDSFEALISQPLASGEDLAGVVNIYHRKPHEHSAQEVAAVTMAAELFGSAIARIRLREESSLLRRGLELLGAITRATSGSDPQGRSLDGICHLVGRSFDSPMTCILLTGDKSEASSGAYAELPEYLNQVPLEMADSIAKAALRGGKPLAITDFAADVRDSRPATLAGGVFASLLCAPLAMRDGAAGTLNIYSRHRHEFTSAEIEFAAVLANHIVLTIENTRLSSEIAELKRALETRKLVERAKGILQQKHRLTEEEAYLRLRNESRRMRRPMRDLAEAIILTEDLTRKGKEARQE